MIASSVASRLIGIAEGAARASGFQIAPEVVSSMEALLSKPSLEMATSDVEPRHPRLASAERGVMRLVQVMIAEAVRQDADKKILQEDALRSALCVICPIWPWCDVKPPYCT